MVNLTNNLATILTVTLTLCATVSGKDTANNGTSDNRAKIAGSGLPMWYADGPGSARAWTVLPDSGIGLDYRSTTSNSPEKFGNTVEANQPSAVLVTAIIPRELEALEPLPDRVVNPRREYPDTLCRGCDYNMWLNGRIEI